MDYLAPDFGAAALVTIDVQVDTLDGQPSQVAGTSAVVPRITALAAGFRDANQPIVHIVRLYRSDGSNVDLCRRAAVEAGAASLLLDPAARSWHLGSSSILLRWHWTRAACSPGDRKR